MDLGRSRGSQDAPSLLTAFASTAAAAASLARRKLALLDPQVAHEFGIDAAKRALRRPAFRWISRQRFIPWGAQCGEDRGGEQELQACWERTRAVPAVVVERFPAARAHEGKDVLEVRRGARCSSECRRIEWAAPRGEKEDGRETTADLEPTRVEVSVRKAVTRDVEDRPQKESREPRAACGAGRSACRHVKGNYHGA
jgi:hypothetical protein